MAGLITKHPLPARLSGLRQGIFRVCSRQPSAGRVNSQAQAQLSSVTSG